MDATSFETPELAVASGETRIAFRPTPGLPWLFLRPGVPIEVVLNPQTCAVPNAPASMVGALNHGGNVYPVFDLALWAGLPAADANARVLIVGRGDQAAAVRANIEPKVAQVEASAPAGSEVSPALQRFASRLGAIDGDLALEFDFVQWFNVAGHTHAVAGAVGG